ncbi:hypothetical protein ACFJGV_07795 [Cnuibacter sp. UC19_7]|uniref:hypothetical protein n=1 Tax=Cnuibacter sp. UC19_7 TaxID=3350166 RepID=UPI00366EC67A
MISRHRPSRVLLGLAGAAAVLAGVLGSSAAASAAPLVDISVVGGADAAAGAPSTGMPVMNPDGPTQLQVTGSGFQSVAGGFGGIYVLFGWVDPTGSWQPSAGGATGTTYRYAMDDEAAPQGYQQFLSFPGGATEASASGGVLGADGAWATTITVPGPVFQTFDRENNEITVDCVATQCGVITIGAHGVANANNESFTPVTFAQPAPAVSPTPSSTPTPAGGAASASPSAEATTVALETTSGQDDSTLPLVLAAGVLAVVVIAAVVVVLVLRRRRSAP